MNAWRWETKVPDRFTGDVTGEIEQNSKGVNVRIRGNIVWPNATCATSNFMVPMGAYLDKPDEGISHYPLETVIARMTAEARKGIAADLAALEGAS